MSPSFWILQDYFVNFLFFFYWFIASFSFVLLFIVSIKSFLNSIKSTKMIWKKGIHRNRLFIKSLFWMLKGSWNQEITKFFNHYFQCIMSLSRRIIEVINKVVCLDLYFWIIVCSRLDILRKLFRRFLSLYSSFLIFSL